MAALWRERAANQTDPKPPSDLAGPHVYTLAIDSTFYGDLFPHVISWRGELYLEDGLHRVLRATLEQRSALHARVLDLD